MTTSIWQAASAGAGKDTYMDSAAPTTNFGTADPIGCGEVTGKAATIRAPLFGFDLTAPDSGPGPGTDHVQSATFELNITALVNALTYDGSVAQAARAVALQLLRRVDWVEAEATWNIYKAASNWGTAGANSSATDHYLDFDGGVSATELVQSPQATGAYTITFGQAGLRQLMYASANLSGIFGVRMIWQPDDGSSHTFSLSSDDNATLGNRPKLTLIHAPRRIYVS